MTVYNRVGVCFCIRASPDDDPWVNTVHLVTGSYATQAQARVRINAGVDFVEVGKWYESTDAGTLYNGVDISEDDAFAYIQTAMGGHLGTMFPDWRISVYSITTATDSPGEPNTGTTSATPLDDVSYISLGSSQAECDTAILNAIKTARSATASQCFVCVSFVDTVTFDEYAGEGTWEDAAFKWRWCDATDTLQMQLPNGTWYTIKGTVATFQAALDILSDIYPTHDYDAAYNTDTDGCQIVIVKLDSTGTTGNITFDQGFQNLIESSGTWIAPMRFGVDYSKWVVK